MAEIRYETALRTDERVRFMDEIVCGIQLIKMYCWERSFEVLVTAARRLELKMILKNLVIQVFNLTNELFIKRIALFCTILSFIWLYGVEEMTVATMFVTVSLFNTISSILCKGLMAAISEVCELSAAMKRLQTFLQCEEKCESSIETEIITMDNLETQNLAIKLKNVSVAWDTIKNQNICSKIVSKQNDIETKTTESKPFTLRDLNLEVPKGKLVFVVGSVGAGKSTLLQVLLKEISLIQGEMGINGTVSYSSQVSWTFTSTIRQNITFGQPMDRKRYNEVTKCADLIKDFKQFSNGDLTLVGENGAGLSGGQKARIK